MSYKILRSGLPQSEKLTQSGMTFLEMIVAMAMLITFTSVVVVVMQISHRFLVESESNAEPGEIIRGEICRDLQSGETIFTDGERCEPNKGILIDHQEIQMAMDSLVEVLSQPGINVLRGPLPIARPLPLNGSEPKDDDCSENPAIDWRLPMPEVFLPPGYRMCLWITTEIEDPTNSRPGIYLLQALPEQKSFAGLPVRRLFCRPRPYC